MSWLAPWSQLSADAQVCSFSFAQSVVCENNRPVAMYALLLTAHSLAHACPQLSQPCACRVQIQRDELRHLRHHDPVRPSFTAPLPRLSPYRVIGTNVHGTDTPANRAWNQTLPNFFANAALTRLCLFCPLPCVMRSPSWQRAARDISARRAATDTRHGSVDAAVRAPGCAPLPRSHCAVGKWWTRLRSTSRRCSPTSPPSPICAPCASFSSAPALLCPCDL